MWFNVGLSISSYTQSIFATFFSNNVLGMWKLVIKTENIINWFISKQKIFILKHQWLYLNLCNEPRYLGNKISFPLVNNIYVRMQMALITSSHTNYKVKFEVTVSWTCCYISSNFVLFYVNLRWNWRAICIQ